MILTQTYRTHLLYAHSGYTKNWRYTMSAAFGGAGSTVGDLSALARAKDRKDKDVDTSQVGWYRRSQNLKVPTNIHPASYLCPFPITDHSITFGCCA